MKPTSPIFFCAIILSGLALFLATIYLNRKPDSFKRKAYIIICTITVISFFLYKYALSADTEYHEIARSTGGFNWWKELPLHLCNINMLLMPLAVYTRKRPLLSFCFFVAPLGAMMALLMPSIGFSGYSVLLPRMLGYYGTHIMIVLESLALYTLGFYEPEYKDIPKTVILMLPISLTVFAINLALIASGACSDPNYFYIMDPEGNAILELFHSMIPLPYLYLLPCYPILFAYMLLATAVVKKLFPVDSRWKSSSADDTISITQV